MPSYVVTGVSKGLGWEFLNQLSSDANNTVIGIVRNKPATDKRVKEELSGRSNITILEGDLTKYETLKKAAADTATITGGELDYLIANAGSVDTWDAFDPIGVLAEKPEELANHFHMLMDINVLGNIYLYSLFMPQILKGKTKKVILISSGMGDLDMVNQVDLDVAALYGTSKTAANMINAKWSAQYRKDGVLFLSICPGMVDVGHFSNVTPQQTVGMQGMLEKFQKFSPNFKGPDTPPESIKAVMSVVEKCSVQNGDGGAYLSHFGNKQWI